ncbi:unnamed protein product [Periconia digitata]|uniref:feruloyl esterase n=1 Tax=Periconia digitata TaxID=1303443 RepID=A0A9W4UHC1_9PLEO|nr:unnamed protein product [Periconia digitata]
MKWSVVIAASSLLSSVCLADGCSGSLPAGVVSKDATHTVNLNSGRLFHFHLPPGYDAKSPTPVYLSFHGASKWPLAQEALSRLSDSAFNPNGIAVYPKGIGNHLLSHPGTSVDSPNDIDYTHDVLDWLESNLCVDTNRIYATGKSNGGGFVNLLACDPTTNARIAAFASVSGAYYEDKLARNCSPGRPVPFLSFHGTSDTTIPYTGKNATYVFEHDDGKHDWKSPADVELFHTTFPIEDWLKDWVSHNGISKSTVPDTTTLFSGGLVEKRSWSRKGFSNLIEHYKESNLGHAWASKDPNIDCPTILNPKCPMGHYTFDATNIIIKFFSKWTLGGSG